MEFPELKPEGENEIPEEEETIQVIEPELHEMYEYKIDDEEDRLLMEFKIPDEVDPKAITATLNPQHNAICVEIPGKLPFIKGKLLDTVERLYTQVIDKHFVVILQKRTRGIWEVIIEDYYPGTEEMDPQSLLLLGIIPSQIQEEVIKSYGYMLKSAQHNFVPAMCHLASFIQRTDMGYMADFEAERLLTTAAHDYKSPMAMVNLADFYLRKKDRPAAALKYLHEAIDKGYNMAHLILGLAFSPISDYKGIRKNAQEAIKELELVEDSADALHHMALIYFNGAGVKRNLPKANELQQRARKLNKNIAPLYIVEMSTEKKALIAFILILLALGVAYGLNLLMKYYKF